jgi:hypothetical protein
LWQKFLSFYQSIVTSGFHYPPGRADFGQKRAKIKPPTVLKEPVDGLSTKWVLPNIFQHVHRMKR